MMRHFARRTSLTLRRYVWDKERKVTQMIDEFLNNYVWKNGDERHTPTERERAMLKDAIDRYAYSAGILINGEAPQWEAYAVSYATLDRVQETIKGGGFSDEGPLVWVAWPGGQE